MNVNKIVSKLEELKMTEHYECDDCFYSCPMHEDYCGEHDRDECTCGLEVYNEKVDEIIRMVNDE